MIRNKSILIILLLAVQTASFCVFVNAQRSRERVKRNVCSPASGLTGVYSIDVENSDRLYTVIEGASSKVPFGDQQQFFIDLAVRLTPPDLLAIECKGTRVSLGSSRSSRMEFVADGTIRTSRDADGHIVKTRIGLESNNLIFTSNGKNNDNLSFTFTPIENGRRLRVIRRISSEELIEPVVIRTVYNKISDVARWDIYSDSRTESQTAERVVKAPGATVTNNSGSNTGIDNNNEFSAIRAALYQWIDATNAADIERQMSFYLPQLQAFYLSRNAPRSAVRTEKIRSFAGAKTIDIRAQEPEIIFQDNGKTAVMRFRKRYMIESAGKNRRGEVIQELRWRKTGNGWKIFSERDIKVIS